MKNNILFRIIAALILFACIVWGYWWLAWIIAIILLFIFPVYFEILVAGILYDALYGVALPEIFHMRCMFTIISFILFFTSLFLKKRLIAYDS